MFPPRGHTPERDHPKGTSPMIVSATPADHAIGRAQWLQCADGLDTGRDVNGIIIPSYSLDWSTRSPVILLRGVDG